MSVIETSYASGVVRCVIDRDINSTHSQVFSLSRNWYLLRASGPVSGREINANVKRRPQNVFSDCATQQELDNREGGLCFFAALFVIF